MWAVCPSKDLLCNAELAHIFTREAKTFGIKVDGEISFDYGGGLPPQPEVAAAGTRPSMFEEIRGGVARTTSEAQLPPWFQPFTDAEKRDLAGGRPRG